MIDDEDRLLIDQLDEGELVHRLFRAEPPFDRPDAPEPSALPHLARVCHDFSIGEIWTAAEVLGLEAGPMAWPQILESTTATLAARFLDDELRLQTGRELVVVEARVHRQVAAGAPGSPELWDELAGVDGRSDRRDALRARLLLAGGAEDRFDQVLDDLDPGFIQPETARSMIEVANRIGRQLPDGWIEAFVASGWFVGHTVHVLPVIPDQAQRAELADEVIERVNAEQGPPWWLALVVSQVAPHASGAVDWNLDVWEPEELWAPLIDDLLAAPGVDPTEALLRAHPLREFFDRIRGPHETTGGVADEMLYRHGGSGPPTASPPPAGVPLPESPSVEPPPPAGSVDTPRSHDPAGDDPTPIDDRRLGIDVGDELPLVAGTPTTVEVSIAPVGAASTQVKEAMGLDFAPGVSVRELPVRFVGGGIDEIKTMRLPRDPSSIGAVDFEVTPSGSTFRGYVLVYNEVLSAVLRAAELTVPVRSGPDEAADDREPALRLVDVHSLVLSPPPDSASLVATADDEVFGSGLDVRIPAATSAVIDQTDQVVAGLVAAGGQRLHAGAPAASTLRAAARVGAQLRTELGLDALQHVRHIQMVSFSKQTVFPLDLIYGGPEPDPDAEPCDRWTDVLSDQATDLAETDTTAADGGDRTGVRCPSCAQLDDAAARQVVCPLRFWGLEKVIEHHWPEGTSDGQWVARVHRDSDEDVASPLTRVLAGASELVVQETGAADVDAALAAVRGLLPGQVTIAPDWASWRVAVADEAPSLLVALAHHDEIMEDLIRRPALEIGGDASVINEGLVRSPDRAPGPLVLLLGCNTGVSHEGILSFAAVFRSYAPVVVATVGEVIAEEAPVIAEAIVSELLSSAGDGRTVGEAVRNARRALLAEGRPVALQLLLHGESEWRIERPVEV